MVNVVPREVPKPKPEGPQAPRVLALCSRVPPKATLVMIKTSTTHFPVPFGLIFQIFSTIFSTPCNFWPPLRMKNRKNCQNVDLDSSKEGVWCTECNTKNLSSLQSTISEKIEKNQLKMVKNGQNGKNYQFEPIFLIFSEMVLCFLGWSKVTQSRKNGWKKFKQKKIWKIRQNGTIKWVVQVL